MTRDRYAAYWIATTGACALIIAGLIAPMTAYGQEDQRSDRSNASEQTFSTPVGRDVLATLELEAQELWTEAIEAYSALLQREVLSAFERASVLKLRGRAYYELDQLGQTITDWQSAIALQALNLEETNILRVNTGQLLMAEGDIQGGLELIELAIANGTVLSVDLAMRLASGYAQLDDIRPGLAYAIQVREMAERPEERHYSLLLYYYQSLDMEAEQLSLIEDMVNYWPETKENWTSYASLLANAGREEEAFQVNAIMYLNGMLVSSEEILRLAQYYSFYGYPYRGASILERELNAGVIEPTPAHYAQLANFWRQAREWERALPVLQRVATMTGAGPDYQKLGEALYQVGNFSEAEAVFAQALTRDDLNRPGDTWNLLGQVRYEQRKFVPAIDAYEEGLGFDYSRAGAQGWIDFIERSIAINIAAEGFADQVEMERCNTHVEEVRREWYYREDRRFDSENRPILPLDADCLVYFDPYGVLRPEFEPM